VFGYDGKSFTVIDDKSLGLDEATGWLHVRCVLEDSKGNLWIGNNGIGVILHDGRTGTRFTQEKGLGKLGPHGGRTKPQPGDVTDGSPTMHRVFSIGEDRAGNIWFGTVEHGAWRYDGKSLRNYTAADGLTSKDILCIYTDRRGDLWLAGNGVFKFNGASFDRIH
jgi:ligand-binding sensor domain-containing protein